ncbi:tyrosine-type recombinase/integrase, partial [Streptomyces calidiresistens]
MASIVERPKKDGSVTYQVKWREGGGRGAPGQSENFTDRDQAETFKRLVDAHGQRWPRGWVRGKGFVEEQAEPDDVPWLEWALRYVGRLTGVDARTKRDYARMLEQSMDLHHTTHSGLVVQGTIKNLTADDVQDWVRVQEEGERDPVDGERWVQEPKSPKTISNRHGLLFTIFAAAVKAKVREDNPCEGTRLPRTDDQLVEEMVFLEREEYRRLAGGIRDPRARLLADWLVGTGMRWGEATAVQTRDISLSQGTVTVQRAWKKTPDGYRLGPPKTKRSRRTLALTGTQVDVLRPLLEGRGPEQLVFRTVQDRRWRHSNFWDRQWKPAVDAAVAAGLPRRPRIHDLRHTHVAWLIAKNIPLPAIQARLGHESIKTTVDRYGHLTRELDEEIVAAVDAAMADPVEGAEERGGLRV